MIMPENLNKKLEQKSYKECVTHENYYSAFPAHPSLLYSGLVNPAPPPPSPRPTLKKIQIWILCRNSHIRQLKMRVEGIVLKKLLTYFEMLIVPQSLYYVDSCILPHLTQSGILFWFQCLLPTHPPFPPQPPTTTKKSELLSKFTY